MSDGRIGRKVIAYMCEMRILTKVLGWLSEKNEKFLNIVTDIIDKLISRNSEQMVKGDFGIFSNLAPTHNCVLCRHSSLA
jgi:hypothetical protein